MKTAVTVLYNPTDNQYTNSIQLASQLDMLAVYCNSSVDKNKLISDRIILLGNGTNDGIAKAFNEGIKYLINQGADYIFTFDQDTVVPDNYIEEMIKFAEKYRSEYNKTFVPNFYDIHSKTYATFSDLTQFRLLNHHVKPGDTPCQTTFAISSGTLYLPEIFSHTGFFREDYFIDHVDSEFNLRSRKNGFRVTVNPDMVINHSIGKRQLKKFLGITFKPHFHNHIRRYYIVRNSIDMSKKYFFSYPSFMYLNMLRLIHEVFCILLYEDKKFKKMYSMMKGFFHGLFGITGKQQ